MTKNKTPILTYSYFKEIEILRYVEVPLISGVTQGIIYKQISESEVDFPIQKMKSISKVLNLYISLPYFQTLIFMKNYYFSSFPAVLKFLYPQPIQYGNSKPFQIQKKLELSPAQNKIFQEIKKNKISLLFGDTGSGKTVIYKKMIDEVLQKDGDILFLVPEINLIPQMIKRVANIFGNITDSWHSKRTKQDKFLILQNIYQRNTRIIIGTLSSLFLPFQKLSLIIVDEEHSESYSLEENRIFRFNARDMAIYLANKLDIPIILGSATPSLNSYVKFPSLRLKGQFFTGKKDYIFDKSDFSITDMMLEKIGERLEKKEQSIVFIPTRGNFKYLQCLSCQENYSCQNCSIRLTLYSDKNIIKCNKCGYFESLPEVCKSCGESSLKVSRAGTVEIVRTLKKKFPKAEIINFDSDKIKKLEDIKRVLTDFQENKLDILVGTQMIAKGHDYPNVTLSIILGLDFAINMTDFQSYEKTLSLVVQLAGRSGRTKDSEIIIQSRYDKFYKKYIHDYEEFLKYEAENRLGLFPPYTNFIRILIEDISEESGKEILNHIELYIILFSKIKIFISGEAPIKKILRKHRFHIILKTEKISSAMPFIKEMLELIPKDFRKKMAIEINPTSYS